jgi:hypothetical protein
MIQVMMLCWANGHVGAGAPLVLLAAVLLVVALLGSMSREEGS